ncbi:MAG: glycoside hydrolase family 2 protein [Bacteroidetes bacterium]|nr:glycoside hydrolase family 2 protein [Bacteroidota bacterium]
MARSVILATVIMLLFQLGSFSQERVTTILREGWRFSKGASPGASDPQFDDSGWQQVPVPHDWAIAGPFIKDGDGNTGKLPWKGEGWYRRQLEIPEEYAGRRIYLLFDGVMAFPAVYVNGHLAGRWDYGYNSFYIDITPHITPGSANMLAVHADTRPHDSRWYPGAGIYRKVSMIVTGPVHTAIWGTWISTPVIRPHYADVRIATTVRNSLQTGSEIVLRHAVVNQAGNVVARKEIKGFIGEGNENILEATVTLMNPRRWDIDDPHLYTLETSIIVNGELADSYESTFGVREIRITADDGLWLNGRRVQLKGVNLHHDLGALGSAMNYRALERQLEIMKEMGCNAIRTSHNTAAPELPALCDRMGLLFFNEVFDKYDAKAGITDTTDFESFAHRNIRNFVVRDRNHPSLFIWSVGNEIGNVQWNIDNGFMKLQTMVNYVRKYDPHRPVTLVCDSEASAALRHFDYYDVHSWNYGRRYKLARQMEPNKSVIISESASTVSTRDFYELPLPLLKTDFTRSLQVSSYDLNAPEWAELADDDFMWQQEEPYIAGEFVWTGFDYLGEPTPYTNEWARKNGLGDIAAARSSYFGIVDLNGIPKDRYWLYRSYWRSDVTTIHILPHWNWENMKGKRVPVFVYTSGDCAELFLNGRSLGRQCKDPKSEVSTRRFRLMWNDVVYEPGELRAVAYREGVAIGETVVRTAGKTSAIVLSADRTQLNPDGDDLAYIVVEGVDRDGNLSPLAGNMVEIKVSGAGTLAATDNGNPQSFEPFSSPSVKLFNGKAMVIVRSGKESGTIVVEATSAGLAGARLEIRVR